MCSLIAVNRENFRIRVLCNPHGTQVVRQIVAVTIRNMEPDRKDAVGV